MSLHPVRAEMWRESQKRILQASPVARCPGLRQLASPGAEALSLLSASSRWLSLRNLCHIEFICVAGEPVIH